MKLNDEQIFSAQTAVSIKSDKKWLSGTSSDHIVYSEEEESKAVRIYIKFRRQITDDPKYKH
jgi:hypothetical protein